MPAAARLGALVVGLAAACGEPPMGPVGVSTQRAEMQLPRRAVADAGAGVPSPVPPGFRQGMARVAERAVSRGHAERFDAVVYANDAARAAWEQDGEMPEGAMLVEDAIERTPKGDRAAGLLVMEKRGGTWRFTAVDAGGHVVPDTREAACAACHRDAPRDFVFRPR